MEETKSIHSAAEVVALPKHLHYRTRPDVPEDVDFLMEHLNDPNLDLQEAVRHSVDRKPAISHYSGGTSDIDTESHFGSEGRTASRAGSKYELDFEKYVVSICQSFQFDTLSVSLHILKSERRFQMSTIQQCQSIPFACKDIPPIGREIS